MNKRMKKIICAGAAFMMLISVTGCSETKKAESTVDKMFTAYQSSDLDTVSDYFVDGSSEITDSNSFAGQFLQIVLNNFEYEILSSEQENDETVFVNTQITTTDMVPVAKELTKNTISSAIGSFFGDSVTDEQKSAEIVEEAIKDIDQENLDTVTNEINIKVVKTDEGEWKIDADENFTNAILGGLVDALGVF